jgi:hypothetical protein
MGGSGGSIGYGWNPEKLAREVREAEQRVQSEAFKSELAGLISSLLARINDRDAKLVQRRLKEITDALSGVLADHIDQIFGGSVAKRTYVDGLSDVDCLLVVAGDELAKQGPKATLNKVAKTLADRLAGQAEVSAGDMAVTVKYADGLEIQLLPAARNGDRLVIPSSRVKGEWSTVNPKKFQEGLSKYNQQCDGKLVPTIKLAKAILGKLPEAQQLSGYHVESLAIDAFKNYTGLKTPAAMLPHFFEHAKERVKLPMTDSTGQSVHVDGYMGEADSQARMNASHILGRIFKRFSNAAAAESINQWKDIFGIDE